MHVQLSKPYYSEIGYFDIDKSLIMHVCKFTKANAVEAIRYELFRNCPRYHCGMCNNDVFLSYFAAAFSLTLSDL